MQIAVVDWSMQAAGFDFGRQAAAEEWQHTSAAEKIAVVAALATDWGLVLGLGNPVIGVESPDVVRAVGVVADPVDWVASCSFTCSQLLKQSYHKDLRSYIKRCWPSDLHLFVCL